MLRPIAGKPLLAWTYQAARACPELDEVIVAVDSEEIATLCRLNDWPYRMTPPELASGTDRLHAVSLEVQADIYVNVQGDEPLISSTHMSTLLAPFNEELADVTTLKVLCTPEEISDPNAVKVVTALDDRALYFSRAPIPYPRDTSGSVPHFKHLGLYAYKKAALQRFATLPPSPLEQVEKLEQLRLLENGLSLYVREVASPTIGVDTEDDLLRVEAVLLSKRSQDSG